MSAPPSAENSESGRAGYEREKVLPLERYLQLDAVTL
jgi:hypothetical protein